MEVKDAEKNLAIDLPASLQRRLDRDAEFVRQGRITKLPARCTVLAALEAFIRWKVYATLSEFVSERANADGGDACELRSAVEARQFRKQIALEKVRFLIEVADAIRVCFDNLLPLMLLRKEERDAYELFEEKLSYLDHAESPRPSAPASVSAAPSRRASQSASERPKTECAGAILGAPSGLVHVSGAMKRKAAPDDSLEQIFSLYCHAKRSRAASLRSAPQLDCAETEKPVADDARRRARPITRRTSTRSETAAPTNTMLPRERRRGKDRQNHTSGEAEPVASDSCVAQLGDGELAHVESFYSTHGHGDDTSLLVPNSLDCDRASQHLEAFIDTLCSPSWHIMAHPSWVAERSGLQNAPTRRDFMRPSLVFGTTYLVRLLTKLTAIRRAQLDVLAVRHVAPASTSPSTKQLKGKVKSKQKQKQKEATRVYDSSILEGFCVAETNCVLRELVEFLADAADGVQKTPPPPPTARCLDTGVSFECDADYVSVGEQCAFARRTCATELYLAVLSTNFRCCCFSRAPFAHIHAGRNGSTLTARHCAPLCSRPLAAQVVS